MSATPIQARDLGRAIRRAVKSDEAYAILGKHGTWTAGGCWILAAALKRLLGRRSRLAVVRRGEEPVAQHILVELDGVFLDADGASTEEQLLRRWRDLEGVQSPGVTALTADMARRARADSIPFSAGKARRLAAYLSRAIPAIARRPDRQM
jgi:hypothetical protein